jgi:hypothetical protein
MQTLAQFVWLINNLTHVQTLQILEIDSIDIDQACEFLDKAYDFTPHKTKPSIKRP